MKIGSGTYQAAIHKAEKMKEQNPDAIIFVIYDFEAQQHDALTHEQLEEIYTLEFRFVIKCEL